MNSDSTKIILVAITVILVFAVAIFGLYKYIANESRDEIVQTEKAVENLFPESDRATLPSDPSDASGNQITDGQNELGADDNRAAIDNPKIKIVSERPVAGATFMGDTVFRYMERESGHIYEISVNENLSKKISNTTITRIRQSFFNNTGMNVLLRRLDEENNIENIYTVVGSTTEPSSLNQSLLPPNLREVAVSPSRDKIFYLSEVGENFIGTIEEFDKKKSASGKKQIFDSPLGEWLVEWPENSTLFFNTKPSAKVPGFLYSQKTTGATTKVLGEINGLTSSVSPNLKKLIYSESANDQIKTYLHDLPKKESVALQLKTLPEKCVWGGVEKEIIYCAVPESLPKSNYPDSWYQGLVSFDDELWKIDARTGNSEILFDKLALSKRETKVDAVDLKLNPKEDYLLLTNKKDSSLWLISLK